MYKYSFSVCAQAGGGAGSWLIVSIGLSLLDSNAAIFVEKFGVHFSENAKIIGETWRAPADAIV